MWRTSPLSWQRMYMPLISTIWTPLFFEQIHIKKAYHNLYTLHINLYIHMAGSYSSCFGDFIGVDWGVLRAFHGARWPIGWVIWGGVDLWFWDIFRFVFNRMHRGWVGRALSHVALHSLVGYLKKVIFKGKLDKNSILTIKIQFLGYFELKNTFLGGKKFFLKTFLIQKLCFY